MYRSLSIGYRISGEKLMQNSTKLEQSYRLKSVNTNMYKLQIQHQVKYNIQTYKLFNYVQILIQGLKINER